MRHRIQRGDRVGSGGEGRVPPTQHSAGTAGHTGAGQHTAGSDRQKEAAGSQLQVGWFSSFLVYPRARVLTCFLYGPRKKRNWDKRKKKRINVVFIRNFFLKVQICALNFRNIAKFSSYFCIKKKV